MTAIATPLDRAHDAAMRPGAPDDAMARFYALLLETTILTPVRPAPEDAPIAPLVFDLEDGPVALGFDDEARMTGFLEGPTEYVALAGRSLIAALAEARLGLGLNLGDAPSATLLDAATVRWIAAEMGGEVEATDLTGTVALGAPHAPPRALLVALAERVAQMPGLVAEAWLVTLGSGDARAGLCLLILPGALAARAVPGIVSVLGRAAAVHGAEAGTVQVGVLQEGHPLLPAARSHGLALHAPDEAARPQATRPVGAPPRLR